MVKKGTIINLVMGGGLSDEQVHVPLLIGLKREQALKVLRSGSLNRGAEFFDKTVITSNDTMEATIWKQIPKYGKAMISLGTYVDIWLSRDKDKIELDSNAVHMVDSLGTE